MSAESSGRESLPASQSEKPAKWLWGTLTARDLNPAYVSWLERENERLRDRLDRALSYREAMENLPEGTIPRA